MTETRKGDYEIRRHKVFGITLAVYERLGSVATFRILGWAVWERMGSNANLLGFKYQCKEG